MSLPRVQEGLVPDAAEKSLQDLMTYPKGERIASGVALSLMAVVFGVSTGLSFLFAASLPIWWLIAAGVVVVTTTVKSIRGIYTANQEEKRKTTEALPRGSRQESGLDFSLD